MGDEESIVTHRLNELQGDVSDHETRLRNVEAAQARSAWLSTLVTPVLTAVAVLVVTQALPV